MAQLFLISGNDDFTIKTRSRKIVSEICGTEEFESCEDLEIIRGDSDDLSVHEILELLISSLQTPPFLSDRKIIWLRHFQYFEKLSGANAAKRDSELLDELGAMIKAGLSDDTALIIDGVGIDQRKSFYKSCKAANAQCEFFKTADAASGDFVRNQHQRIVESCGKEHKNIEPRAIDFLIEAVGSDSGRLASELEKLFCYVDSATNITLADCQAVCSRTPEALAWAFSNALVSKNTRAALEAIAVMIEQMKSSRGSGGMELAILHSAVNAFQELFAAAASAAEINLPQRVDKNYFYAIEPGIKEQYPDNMLLKVHPFRAYKICENLGRFPGAKLAEIFDELVQANRKLVSGGGNPRIILENLALKITA